MSASEMSAIFNKHSMKSDSNPWLDSLKKQRLTIGDSFLHSISALGEKALTDALDGEFANDIYFLNCEESENRPPVIFKPGRVDVVNSRLLEELAALVGLGKVLPVSTGGDVARVVSRLDQNTEYTVISKDSSRFAIAFDQAFPVVGGSISRAVLDFDRPVLGYDIDDCDHERALIFDMGSEDVFVVLESDELELSGCAGDEHYELESDDEGSFEFEVSESSEFEAFESSDFVLIGGGRRKVIPLGDGLYTLAGDSVTQYRMMEKAGDVLNAYLVPVDSLVSAESADHKIGSEDGLTIYSAQGKSLATFTDSMWSVGGVGDDLHVRRNADIPYSLIKLDNVIASELDRYQVVGLRIDGLVQERLRNPYFGPEGMPLDIQNSKQSKQIQEFYESLDTAAFDRVFLASILARPQDGKVEALDKANYLFDEAVGGKRTPYLIDSGEWFPANNSKSEDPVILERSHGKTVHPVRCGLMAFPQSAGVLSGERKRKVISHLTRIVESKEGQLELFDAFIALGQIKEKQKTAYAEVVDRIKRFLETSTGTEWALQDLFFSVFPEYKLHWDVLERAGFPPEQIVASVGFSSFEDDSLRYAPK